jgi:O-antigen/teichoic acid export membrane protein
MTIPTRFLLKGTAWTVGAYGVGQLLRLVTNIFLARLLAPELFGIMLIVNSVRTGIDLMSDVGIGQNIIYHRDANDPEFYNTAWTLQVIRSVALWLAAVALAVPVARFYHSSVLVYILPLSAFGIILAGLTSIAQPLLTKRLQIAKLNVFDVIVSFISSIVYIILAYSNPSIWSLVFGGLFGYALPMVGSYFLLPGVTQRFYLSKKYVWEILQFGKWIFVSSIVYFLSTNFDRLYLAKVIPLNVLGVYGIARSISDLFGLVVSRLGNYVLFPLISSQSHVPRDHLREQLASIRLKLLLLAAAGLSLSASLADLAIKVLYDYRYHAASWMLPVMITGSWFSILATLNESTLLGLGKPSYSAISNGSKFGVLLVALPLGAQISGIEGCVIVVGLIDLCRYFPIFIGQLRERFSFCRQDLFMTLAMFSMIGFWEWLRWIFGFGTSFQSFPIELGAWLGAAH